MARNSYGKRRFDYSEPSSNSIKRHYSDEDRSSEDNNNNSTVFRYLCPVPKVGSILGRGGEIAKQLRAETGARINIGETVNNCEERVVTIVSWKGNKEAGEVVVGEVRVSPAEDALVRVHERIVGDLGAGGEGEEGEAVADPSQVTARLLVPSDQIGCVIGKGGMIIQGIRSDTGTQIRIMKDNHLPACALPGDELLQIVGDSLAVNKALTAVAAKLHNNPSHCSKALAQGRGRIHSGRDTWQEPAPYGGGYSRERERDYPAYMPPPPRDEYSAREFSLKIVCNSALVGGVIGKGGGIINQIRQDSRASIKVETESVEEDCVIVVSARELFEDVVSPTIDAAVRLQPRCSEKNDPEAPDAIFTTRLLVPSSRIGCLLGKGGSIITEMRKMTCAGIKIVSKDQMPKVAAVEDEMVQISGELDVARQALIQVATRLKANFFERERDLGGFVPPPPLRRSISPEPSRYSGRDRDRYADVDRYAPPPQSGGGGYGGSYSRRSGSNGPHSRYH